jgi:hypothetical protein
LTTASGADVAAGAGPVLDDEGLPQPLRQPLPDQPRRDVDPAAGGKACDDPHRAGRIFLRRRAPRQRRGGERGRGGFHQCAAEKVHGARPL